MSEETFDGPALREEDNGTPEQFNERVRTSAHSAGKAIGGATTKDPKIAGQFATVAQEVVSEISA